MKTGALGKEYTDREVIFRQGELGNCMYVILEGQVEVYLEKDGGEVSLRLCQVGDFLGEMAVFSGEVRSASARALGRVRMLTVDKKSFLRRIHEDPTIAFRLVEGLIQRIRELNEDINNLNRVVQECLGKQVGQG